MTVRSASIRTIYAKITNHGTIKCSCCPYYKRIWYYLNTKTKSQQNYNTEFTYCIDAGVVMPATTAASDRWVGVDSAELNAATIPGAAEIVACDDEALLGTTNCCCCCCWKDRPLLVPSGVESFERFCCTMPRRTSAIDELTSLVLANGSKTEVFGDNGWGRPFCITLRNGTRKKRLKAVTVFKKINRCQDRMWSSSNRWWTKADRLLSSTNSVNILRYSAHCMLSYH